jgi:hypothetical protein
MSSRLRGLSFLEEEDGVTEPSQTALVIRGVVELGDNAEDESERDKGRTSGWSRTRRYHPGQLVSLSIDDLMRLQKIGAVKAI